MKNRKLFSTWFIFVAFSVLLCGCASHEMKLSNHISKGNAVKVDAIVSAHPDLLQPALQKAVEVDQPEIVRLLLDKGAKVDVMTVHRSKDSFFPEQMQEFLAAANKVDSLMKKLGFKKKGNVALSRGPLHNVTTILCLAAENGNKDIIDVLLAKGAHVNEDGDSPLHIASTEGHLETVESLLAHGADISARNTCGETPLVTAASFRHKGIVDLLLAKGADKTLLSNMSAPIHIKFVNESVSELLVHFEGSESDICGGRTSWNHWLESERQGKGNDFSIPVNQSKEIEVIPGLCGVILSCKEGSAEVPVALLMWAVVPHDETWIWKSALDFQRVRVKANGETEEVDSRAGEQITAVAEGNTTVIHGLWYVPGYSQGVK